MDLEAKKLSLVKLFLSFPSASRMDETAVGSMTAAYLETLQPFSSATLSRACDAFRRKSSAFPPSSGEIYSECLAIDDRNRKAQAPIREKAPRLPPPPRRNFTLAQLADFDLIINSLAPPYTMRVDESGAPLTIPMALPGGGTPTFYGYLTPAESRRRAPSEFLENGDLSWT